MGRPREHDARTRAALLAAAERLIEQRGPEAATVRAVADAVGASTRAVYSVFGSKDGLLEALATRLFEMLSEAIDACGSTDDPAADVVTASLDGFRRTALEHPALYGLVFLRVVPDLRLGPQFTEAAGAAFQRLRAHLDRLDHVTGLGGRSCDDAARAVHALTEGLAGMELRGMIGADGGAERVWRDALTALVQGFSAAPVASLRPA